MEQIPAQIDNETMNETNETVEAEPTISVYETAVSSSSSSSSEESDSGKNCKLFASYFDFCKFIEIFA